MPDESHLDLKYFIDPTIYNCPYCKRERKNVQLSYTDRSSLPLQFYTDCIILVRCR